MTITQHTPTPWIICGHHRKDTNQITYVIPTATNEEFQANATFIVRACNNFDKLLAACKEAQGLLDWCMRAMPTLCIPIDSSVAHIQTAIAEAEKEN